MKEELVSIIVPVYNVQGYLMRCLKSLAAQTYKNIEIIIVDDGSTDDSGRICTEFAKKDTRFRVVHKKNGGLSSARNIGIKKSRGEWLCFVDSDDFVKEDFVRKMKIAMDEKGADIVVCGYNNEMTGEKILCGDDATKELLINQENINIVVWNKMYRKRLFLENNILFPEGKNYEDTLTTYKLLSKAKKIVYISDVLYIYEKRDGSITSKGKEEESFKAREQAAIEAKNFFKGNNHDLFLAADASLLLAKYAFIDAVIRGDIEEKYFKKERNWIKQNINKYKKNKYVSKKVKLYNVLIMNFGGLGYRIFRKIKHE